MREISAALVLLAYIGLCVICWLRYRRRQNFSAPVSIITADTVLVAYASQTGRAEQLAHRTAEQLREAGLRAEVLPMQQVKAQHLQDVQQALFVVSTYGEGEAPDNGASFSRRFLTANIELNLSHLRIGILALGDSDYRHFCGFGHALAQGLHRLGAHALFDLVEVDKQDASALRHWQYYLGQLTGKSHFADWTPASYSTWHLQSRECLNPGSTANPAFHLRLVPASGSIEAEQWQAGDIAEIGPCNSPTAVKNFLHELGLDGQTPATGDALPLEQVLMRRSLADDPELLNLYRAMSAEELVKHLPELPHREYSIASLPQDGTLDLLVRQVQLGENRLGLGSGWLTAYAQTGDDIALRLRTNPRFHSPRDDRPMILIGNGTGLAGLRAHLRARIRAGHLRNWLLFGERTLVNDFFFADEILAWKKQGYLEHLDLAFSRDQGERRYVQHLLLEKRDLVRQWVQDGAAIYVCGSLEGMAQGVDEALTSILGEETLESLSDSDGYCRDVY